MLTGDHRSVRLVLLGGFLGAGKTTTIIRLAKEWIAAGRRVGIITNDQAAHLVDTEMLRSNTIDVAEVSGGCFCCRFPDFLASAEELLSSANPDIIFAEPVGSCTDIVATVVNPLRQQHGSRFVVGPYTVVVDPLRALAVLGGSTGSGLSDKISYIYRLQQQEAAALAINKIDAVEDSDRRRVEALLRSHVPTARIFHYSALTGEGLGSLSSWLELGDVAPPSVPDLDYDVYAVGEAALGWLNATAAVSASSVFDIDDAAVNLASRLAETLFSLRLPIGHCKVLLRGARRTAVANFLEDAKSVRLSQAADEHSTSADVVVNLRVEATPSALHDAFMGCFDDWVAKLGFNVSAASGQCFSPPRPLPTHRTIG